MTTKKLTKRIESEIQKLVGQYGYSELVLSEFALFVLGKEATQTTKGRAKIKETSSTELAKTKAKTKEISPLKPTKTKKAQSEELSLPKLKQAIYEYFRVKDTSALKKSGAFQMATSGIDKLDLSKKAGWESLYRKLIGVLPTEKNEQGYGCINGIDIFKYDFPWKAFGLDPKTSTTEDVKSAYRQLSKVYHPDIPVTGDANIFDRLTVFYNSLTQRF